MVDIDAQGNLSTPGDLTAGIGSGVAGNLELPQGSLAPINDPNAFYLSAPASIPVSYQWTVPTSQGIGFLYNDGTGQLSYQNPTGTSTATITNTTSIGGSGAVVQIQKQVLSSSSPNIIFTNIPGSYSSLRLILYGRGDNVSNGANVFVQFNGDIGTNYNWNILSQQNQSVQSYSGYATNSGLIGPITAASNTANFMGVMSLELPGYSQTTFYKQGMTQSSQRGYPVSNFVSVGTLDWMSVVAITSMTLVPQAGNFIVGTTAILYGII